MAFQGKTPAEKFRTKINNLLQDKSIKESNNTIKARNRVLFRFNSSKVKYGRTRYYPTKVVALVQDDFAVTIPLTDPNLSLFSSNLSNPPKGAKTVVRLFRQATDMSVSEIELGAAENDYDNGRLSMTKELYLQLNTINREESVDKSIRFRNRALPFLNSTYGLALDTAEASRDYSLLLEEIIASGEFTQQDIASLITKLDTGEFNDIVIAKQVNKQVEWLIDIVQEIIDTPVLNKATAQNLGKQHFGFSKTSITGPEHLMEKILTKYGRNSLFGVPVLINTDKYVTHAHGLSRSQFDIILINHLCDLELVELKRPDAVVLDFDENRAKFYASKDLSVAVSQAERYVSAVNKDNDEDYKIDGMKIRAFLNSKVGGTMTVEICRPSAIIVIGTFQTLAKDYDTLKDSTKKKFSQEQYNCNYLQAYKELKSAFKNIQIITYSELLETARARLAIERQTPNKSDAGDD